MIDLAALGYQMRRESEAWFPSWHDGTLPLSIAYTLGLCGEVGEVANDVKKMHRDRNQDDHVRATAAARLALELADVFTYLLLLADELDVDLVEAYEAKRRVNVARWGTP